MGPRIVAAKPIRPTVEEIPDEGDGPAFVSPGIEDELLGTPPGGVPTSKFAYNARKGKAPREKGDVPAKPPTIRCVKARSMPPGKSALGITALSVLDGRLGNLEGPVTQLRLDSGADITLISEECYRSLPSRPKLQKGMKLSLFELTNQAKILGFINITVLMPTTNGQWLEFVEEAYVIPGMNVPILLGEDFQVNFEVSVHRTAQDSLLSIHQPMGTFLVQAHSTPSFTPNVGVRPSHPEGIRDREAYLAASREREQKREATHPPTGAPSQSEQKRETAYVEPKDRIVRSAEDRRISPGCNALVRAQGTFQGLENWYLESLTIQTKDGYVLAPTSCLIQSGSPSVHVFNPSPSWKWIRRGDPIGILYDPNEYFDEDEGGQQADSLKAYANVIQKVAKGTLGEQDLAERPLRRAQEEEIPPEPDGPDELWGPKTSEPADPTTYSSADLESIIDISPDAPADIRERTLDLIRKRIKAFGFDDRLGTSHTIAKIRLKEGVDPISLPMYGASPAKRKVIDEQMDKWIKQEVIEPSKSPWGAPVVIAYRNGKPRFCVDYRKLNAQTIPDEFPIPRQKEILQALSGAQVLSVVDALSGFHQMLMEEDDCEKTAFRSHRGLWQFKRMPFGLRNGPSIFQRTMQSMLAPYLWIFTLVYIDDIVIYSKSYEDHLGHLDLVLQACEEANLTLSPKKCHFMYTSIMLLGQKVSRLGLSTHKEKIQAVVDLARPTTRSTLQTFLGMAVYFSHYIPFYSDRAAPLFALLRKDVPWAWGAEQEQAFIDIKEALTQAPVLGHPMPGLPYRIYSDASDVAIGASLQQVQPIQLKDLRGTKLYERVLAAHQKGETVPKLVRQASKLTNDIPPQEPWAAQVDDTVVAVERVIAYWSRSLKSAERNYSATEREALGVKEALVHFQPFIEGETNIVITDHAALQWARTYENANRRLAAWGAVFGAFPGLDIVHRPGVVHSNVDPLSRLRRIPPHQSPVTDPTLPVPTQLPEQSLLAWGDSLERIPAEKVAFLTTRAQAKAQPKTSKADGKSTNEGRLEKEMSQAAQKRSRKANPPGADWLPRGLTITIGPERLQAFVSGYQDDPSFKHAWRAAEAEGAEMSAAQRFYKSDDGLLTFRDADWVPRLCVPKSEVQRLLRESHDNPWETAHAGSSRLFLRLAARFYWPRMWADIVAFTKTCDVCQKTKPDKRGPNGKLLPHSIPLLPFEVVSLDLITGLPKSDGYDAVLVIVDKLTKYVQYIPTTSNLKQDGFARLFLEHVVYKYGIPRQMISDRDSRWAKAFWASIAEHLGLELLLSTSHHPQTDGQTEKANDTLEIALRAYVAGDRHGWAKWLSPLAAAYNSTPHSSTGYSPNFLLMGYTPRSGAQAIDPNPRGVQRIFTHSAAATPFIEELEVHRTRARDALARAQARQARAYNAGRREEEFEEGDEVLLNPHSLELVDVQGTGRKLLQRRIGPFTVTEKINSVVYRLNIPPEYKLHPVVNIQHLTKYYAASEGNERPKLPDLRELAREEEYEVERIVGHRYNKARKRKEYLVRWKSYGPEHDTFEPEFALRNAFSRLREYRAGVNKEIDEKGRGGDPGSEI
jgi:hypothetical protein